MKYTCIIVIGLCVGCREQSREPLRSQLPPNLSKAVEQPLPAPADTLRGSLGHRVTLTGIAEPRKIGAALRGEDFYVWIEGLHDWPQEYSGQRVQVFGVLAERHDLPVFVADTPEKRMLQGIPVPSGTDLREASRRRIIRDATWILSQ